MNGNNREFLRIRDGTGSFDADGLEQVSPPPTAELAQIFHLTLLLLCSKEEEDA
jgi:hypothetical protein